MFQLCKLVSASLLSIGLALSSPGFAAGSGETPARAAAPVMLAADIGGDASNSVAPEGPSFVSNLFSWLGKFHPPSVNFPIAMLLSAVVAEVLWVVTDQPRFRFASRVCVWIGAIGAVGAAGLGWCLAGVRLTDPSWLLTTHRWLGTGTALVAVVALVLSEQSSRRNAPRLKAGFWPGLVVAALLVAVTGFFGGAMIYGIDHYEWPAAAEAPAESTADEKPTDGPDQEQEDGKAEADAVVEMTDEWTYEPAKVTIAAGQTIRWECGPTFEHTVTADPDEAENPENVQLPEGAEAFDSGTIKPGESYSRRFTVPGEYRYFCIPHEAAGMVGEIEVTSKPTEQSSE
jgi:plastocyanin